MYTMFIRSTLEYGSVAWMGADESYLHKLDRVQASAERIGGFEMETLGSRRDAAAVAFALKLMDGRARGVLKDFIPIIEEVKALDVVGAAVRSKQYGWLMPSWIDKVKGHRSLDMYKQSFWGVLPVIWSTLPQGLIREGMSKGWSRIKSRCSKFIKHGILPIQKTLNNELNASALVFVPATMQNA